MADFYAYVVGTGQGVKAFNEANSERCDCACPNETPHNYKRSLCDVNKSLTCLVTGGNDNNNCGGCGNTCPYRTHCSTGNCACDEDRCNNLCLSLLSHPRNCGKCGNICASGYCYQGACWDPPAVPDRCYAVDPFANNPGWASSLSDHLTGSAETWGQPKLSFLGSNLPNFNMLDVLGTITITKDVKVCPGTPYEMDFAGRYRSILTPGPEFGPCRLTVRLGNRVLDQNKKINFQQLWYLGNVIPGAVWGDTFGPYQVPAFNEGDAGTTKDGFSLVVQVAVEVTCSFGIVDLKDFSLHEA